MVARGTGVKTTENKIHRPVGPICSIFEKLEAMDRSLAQPQVKLNLLRNNSLKFQPLEGIEVIILRTSDTFFWL